jgi:hypothetical protein
MRTSIDGPLSYWLTIHKALLEGPFSLLYFRHSSPIFESSD